MKKMVRFFTLAMVATLVFTANLVVAADKYYGEFGNLGVIVIGEPDFIKKAEADICALTTLLRPEKATPEFWLKKKLIVVLQENWPNKDDGSVKVLINYADKYYRMSVDHVGIVDTILVQLLSM